MNTQRKQPTPVLDVSLLEPIHRVERNPTLSSDFKVQVRALIARDFADAFQQVDVIVTPTSPVPPFRLGERTEDPLAMYLADIYTVTASLAGIPGISVPCGETRERLPIGLQILGKHFDETTVLRLAHAYEQARGSVG